MSAPWRQHLRRVWFGAGSTLAVLAIALAVLMALAQLLLPLLARYPHRVARLLGERLQQPVAFASMEGHWQPSGPLLVLHDVRIGQRDGKPALSLPSARVKLDFGALFWPSRHWVNLSLDGLQLSLLRDPHGQWQVAGFGAAGGEDAGKVRLADLPGNLWLDDLDLDIIDAVTDRHYQVRAGPVRLSNDGRALRFAGLLRRGNNARGIRFSGRVADDGDRGRLWLAGRGADFGAMLADADLHGYGVPSGKGDLALWLDWRQQQLTSLTLRTDLRDLVVKAPDRAIDVAHLKGLFQYRREGERARIVFAPGDHGGARVELDGIGSDRLRVGAAVRDLDPAGWLTLASALPQLPDGASRWLATAGPTLHVARASAQWRKDTGLRQLQARFDHLTFATAHGVPGVDHVHGSVLGDADGLALLLPEQPLTLDFGDLFRQPLAFSGFGGDIGAWKHGTDWVIGTDRLDFRSDAVTGHLRGTARLPAAGGAPFADVYAGLDHADVARAKLFWPVATMSPSAVHWLDHGLVGGQVDAAQVVVHGNLADWPFKAHQGRFEARAEISGLTLDYLDDWPRATGIKAVAHFVDNSMLVEAAAGETHGVEVDKAVASIPDFGHSELVLNVAGHGKGRDLLHFVTTSPLGKSQADALAGLQLGGHGDFDFSLLVPLSEKAPDTTLTLAGTARLDDADVDNADWGLHLAGLHGPLRFSEAGLSATDLAATMQGQPVTLGMDIGHVPGRPDWPVRVNLRGRFTLAQLLEGRESLQDLTALGQGSADFNIGFHVDHGASNPVQRSEVLTVRSDLRGMALNLPVPLDKAPAQRLPLTLQLGLPFDEARLDLWLGIGVHARARIPAAAGQPAAVDVMLGGTAPAAALPDKGIRIRGHAQHLDLSGWVKHAMSYSKTSGSNEVPAIDVDLVADEAEIFGKDFNDLKIKLQPELNQLDLSVDGPGMKGTASVPLADLDKRGIVARFDHLYWPSLDEDADVDDNQRPDRGELVRIPTPQEAAAVGIAPQSLPPMHLWIGDLRFGDAHLGQARLETWPTGDGLHVDLLRTQSPWVHMAANGDWTGTAEDSHTHMTISFSAKNLGKMLDAFGYEGMFVGGETRASLDGTWPGAPSSFELANVEGLLKVDIGKGRVPEVKPGMGRLFGLMSIAELPRRLSLDFGDVFGKGFGFDAITGSFHFHDGNADTDDFTVEGPAADMRIKGRVGFRARDYDQHVLAIPHVGNSLPVVGAVVGGPVGAAAGLAVQGLLGKGLNKAASARYHITGSWDDPQIKLVEKHVPHAETPAARPAPAATSTAPASSAPVVVPRPAASISPPPSADGGQTL